MSLTTFLHSGDEIFLPQAGEIWTNQMIRTTQNLELFDYYVVGAILKEVSVGETIKWC